MMKQEKITASQGLKLEIKQYLARNKLSPGALSNKAGLSYSYVQALLAGRIKHVGLESALKLKEAMNEDV